MYAYYKQTSNASKSQFGCWQPLVLEIRKGIPHIDLVTGSGLYREHKHAHLSLKVPPYEKGMLNTISRAELAALLITLRQCRPGVKEQQTRSFRCTSLART